MNTRFSVTLALAIATAAILPTAAAKASIIVSSTAPTGDAAAISQPNQTGTTDKWWSDSKSNTPGQTFTTGTNTGGYNLNSITFQAAQAVKTTYADFTFSLRVSTVSGSTLTPIATDSITGGFSSAVAVGDYLTANFTTPVALNPNTLYAVDIKMLTNPTYTNGIPYIYLDNKNPYSGGEFYTLTNTTPEPTTASLQSGNDALFYIGMTSNGGTVPEPASLGLLSLGGLGLLLLGKRRKTA